MLKVTKEIKKEFYECLDATSESLMEFYEEEDVDHPSEWTKEGIQEHSMNMMDDGHPAIFDIVEDIYRPILGREATEDEVDWFLNEGIYIKV
jgi:hypothetical protein